MIVYRVKDLSGKEILAESLYLPDGQILMKKGVLLKAEYIKYLLDFGIETIWIKNPYQQEITPNYILNKDEIDYFRNELKNVLEQHIYKKNEPLKKIEKLSVEFVTALLQKNLTRAMDIHRGKCDLYEHLIYTTILAVSMGIRMELKREKLEELAFGCMIHDLGLRYINVSYKNCSLDQMTPKEVFELKNHTILGYTSLEDETWISHAVKNIVLSHHEKKDGSGYPLKQKNREKECTIVQICDAFDGKISGIECKKSDLQTTMKEIKSYKNIKYGKKETELLEVIVGKYPCGTMVQIQDNRHGVVISQTDDSKRPELLLLEPNPRRLNLKINTSVKIKE